MTGTVFSVRVSDADYMVAVYEGDVQLISEEGSSTEVGTGEFVSLYERGELPDTLSSEVKDYIDLDAHREAVRLATSPDADPTEESEPSATDDSGDTTADDPSPRRRQRALDALHRGEPERATELLTVELDDTAPEDPASADILLELAQIHLRQLDEPQRAADYLRRLLTRWPDDPAADAVRRHLCADDALHGHHEPLCDDPPLE